MGSRLKEDEKNEKAIRALLRKNPNRRCINCNSLGPQYVCLNFWTFVCTQCSGIHREFTHRVKSVSMSKFSSQEVANLEAGGNERGRETFFKDWDSQRQPLPDSSNVDRLREFIKMVYVEKRFSGERPLPRNRGGDRDETYDNRRPEPRPNYRADSRSPPYEDRYDDRARRSNAGYDDRRPDERGARFDEKRSPARFESDRRYERNYNDARRYDERPRYESRDRQQYEDRYNEGLDRRFEDRFANERGSRGYGSSSPPPIRPVKEILGEDVPPLRVENHGSLANGGRDNDKSHSSQDGRQRFGSSSSFGSVDGNVPAVAPKREDSASLIDFSAEPDPPAPKEQSDPFGLTAAIQPAADTSNSTGWATFEPAAPAPSLGAVAQAPAVPSVQGLLGGFTNSSLGAAAQAPPAPSVQGLLGGFTNPTNVGNGNSQWAAQWTAASGGPSVEASTNNWSSLTGPSAPTMSSQPWNAFSATASEANSLPAPQGSRPVDSQFSSSSTGAATQVVQAQPSGRPEIREDIFGGSFSSVQYTGGQSFTSQYPQMGSMGLMQPGSYSQPQKSSNPFDLPGDSGAGPISGEFPSLSSMHAALPTLNMGPRPAAGPGLNVYGSQWNQTNTMTPPQALYSSAPISSGGGLYFAQQPQRVLPVAMQGSLGPSSGVNLPGTSLGLNMPGGYLSNPNMPGSSLGMNVPGGYPNNPNPKQGSESFFSGPNFQSIPSQNSFGGADSMFTAQGVTGQYSHQNLVGLGAAGNFSSTDSFMAGPVGQHRLLSQSSLGSLSNVPGADSLFPSQPALPGQRLVSHSSLGSLNSMTATDTQFSAQAPQFPTHAVGNPFG